MTDRALRILVIDDEPLARKRLLRLLEKLPGIIAVGQAGDAASAWHLIIGMQPDALLLDIDMPGDNGIELAQRLQSLPHDRRPQVIFTTAHDEYAVAAFAVKAADYLLKPIQQARLQQALRRLLDTGLHRQHEPARISVRSGRSEHWLDINSIACCIASDKYTIIYHDAGEHISLKSLRELEALHDDYFLRVHRNALVARSRILGVHHAAGNKLLVKLHDCQQRPEISRRYRQALQDLLHGWQRQ